MKKEIILLTLIAIAAIYVTRSSASQYFGNIGVANPRFVPRHSSMAEPGDLRSYLHSLGHYYAVVGRPRFGKRQISTKSRMPKNLYNYILTKMRGKFFKRAHTGMIRQVYNYKQRTNY